MYVVPTVLAAGGCTGELSVLDPAGPHAASVARLWWWMLGGAGVLAALVFVLLTLAMRRRGGGPARPGLWIVGLGLAMPCAVLAVLLGHALVVGARILPTAAPDTVEIGVQARRYAWDFRHPGGRTSRDVLHIPAGRPVDLVITATDVIHSVWIPRLAGKMDASFMRY